MTGRGRSLSVAIAFGVLSAFWALFSFVVGGFAYALLWPAASFALVSLAYAKKSVWIFGKRGDGRLAWLSTIVLLPYIAFTWIVWNVHKRLAGEPVAHEILPKLYLGRRPLRSELPEAITLLVDLTAELPSAVASTVPRYVCVPTLDGSVPHSAAFDAAVELVDRHEGAVFVHCAAGRGRSASVVIAVVLRRGLSSTVEEAEAFVRARRPRIGISPSQRALLRRYEPSR